MAEMTFDQALGRSRLIYAAGFIVLLGFLHICALVAKTAAPAINPAFIRYGRWAAWAFVPYSAIALWLMFKSLILKPDLSKLPPRFHDSNYRIFVFHVAQYGMLNSIACCGFFLFIFGRDPFDLYVPVLFTACALLATFPREARCRAWTAPQSSLH